MVKRRRRSYHRADNEHDDLNMEMKVFAPARFAMDALEGSFKGYTDGATWNGWACPYFVRSVAEQVLAASDANGYRCTCDDARDVFLVRSKEDPEDLTPEEFPRLVIIVSEQSIRVYPTGA